MRKLWLTMGIAGLLAFGSTAVAVAGVNDFTIDRFAADYMLSNTDKQGLLRVTERIDVTFSDYNHGLLRALPNDYKGHRLQLHIDSIKSASGAPTQYTTYTQNGNTVLKIGDPSRTVTGHHNYTIAYTLHNVIAFYSDHDELYWDINGDQWAQPTTEVSVDLHLPAGLALSGRQPRCFAGEFGSTQQQCTIAVRGTTIHAQTTQPLGGNQTLTTVSGFTQGYFAPSSWYETAGEYVPSVLSFLATFTLLAGLAGWFWYKHGRDPKGRQIVVPEYEPPKGLGPVEAGTLVDFKTDNRDITATLIGLAVRGYCTIIETIEERTLRPDRKRYSLRLEKTDFAKLDEYEAALLRALFAQQEVGETVDLAALAYKLSGVAATMRSSARANLAAKGYMVKNRLGILLRFGVVFGLAGIVALILAATMQGAAMAGLLVGGGVAALFFYYMPSRTAKGVAAREQLLGLKLYLEVAEAERIKKLQSPNAPYRAASAEPKHTVALFEKLLPYAMVLGVERQWAKQFEGIYRTPPDWYQGNWSSFNALYLVSALDDGVQTTVGAAFSAPSSSSSSGFSGGSAGGGGGGGGGGGW